MRVLSWLGAVVVLIALGAGGLYAAGALTSGTHAPTVPQALVAAAPSVGADAGPRHHAPARPKPSTSPIAAGTTVPSHVGAPARPAPPAYRPALVVRSTQQALINQDRARYGLAPLTWSNCLYSIAVSNAARMAAQGYISHTDGAQRDLGCGLGRQGGENVGWWSGGINDSQLNTMFMNSPDHRANILGPYHYVATAWAIGANGAAYIAVEFA
jgi:uncharacterized protein YkwD